MESSPRRDGRSRPSAALSSAGHSLLSGQFAFVHTFYFRVFFYCLTSFFSFWIVPRTPEVVNKVPSGEPLPCNPAAEAALQPLIRCSGSLSSHMSSSLEELFFSQTPVWPPLSFLLEQACVRSQQGEPNPKDDSLPRKEASACKGFHSTFAASFSHRGVLLGSGSLRLLPNMMCNTASPKTKNLGFRRLDAATLKHHSGTMKVDVSVFPNSLSQRFLVWGSLAEQHN